MEEQGWIYSQVFDSGAPTLVLDRESLHLLAANPPVAVLAGQPLEDLVGRPLAFLASTGMQGPVDWQRHQSAVVRRQDGQEIPVEVVCLFMENGPRPAVVLRLLPQDGTAAGTADVLENRHQALHRAHRELLTAYNRLELLNDELNHRNRELREVYRRLSYASRMAAIGELAAGTTHGINNPLAAAVSAVREMTHQVGALEDGARREKMETLCSRADRALQRIEKIVNDLRRVAQAGTRRGDIKQVELAHEIRLALELIAHRLREIDLQVDVPPGLSVRVSPDELNQVVMNLVDNAATAMGGRGRVRLRVARENEGVAIEVEDDGPGIPEEMLERIFEPFFSTKAPDQGSGIGLAVARGIIEGYAGTLTAESRDGAGSRFIIRLPSEVVCEEAAQNTGG